ncbi:tetratricopeptide repeat protein [bacterium]|nr:tetratricopeptide repeat protein [bacterium]
MANINRVISQAQMLEDQENYEEAYNLLEQNYNELKGDAEFLEKIATLAKTLSKEEETRYWEELVEAKPDSMLAYQELLEKYFGQDKYKYYFTRAKYKILNEKFTQALDDYKKAYDSTTDSKLIVEARFLRAKLLEGLGKNQAAIDEYYRIIELEPIHEAYLKLADLYNSSTDRHSAITVLKQGVELFPDDVMLREFLANLYLKEGQYDDALATTKDTFLTIKALLMKGENEKASELLNSVEDKTISKYHSLMAEYYFNIKDFDKCKEEIQLFREKEPQNPLGFQMLAMICDAKDDLYGYHFNMGRCYSMKQDYELALNEYLNAHKADAKGTEAIKEIIKINEAANNPSILMEFYEKLLKSEPDNVDALKGLAKFYSDMYEFRQALDYLEKWKEVKPNDAQVYNQLVLCYEKLKNFKSAKENYNIYLSKAPLSPDTEKLRERLEKMADDNGPEAEDEGLLDKIMKIFGK